MRVALPSRTPRGSGGEMCEMLVGLREVNVWGVEDRQPVLDPCRVPDVAPGFAASSPV